MTGSARHFCCVFKRQGRQKRARHMTRGAPDGAPLVMCRALFTTEIAVSIVEAVDDGIASCRAAESCRTEDHPEVFELVKIV